MTTEEELPDIDAHDAGKKAEEEKIFKPEDVVSVQAGTLCWKFFHFKEQKNKDGSGQGKPFREKAYCNICGKDLAYGGTTSTLNGHMSHKHTKEWDAAKNEKKMKEDDVKKKIQKITLFATHAQNNNVKTWPKTSVRWQTATKLFAEWTCESTRPSEMADDPGFHRFLNYLVHPLSKVTNILYLLALGTNLVWGPPKKFYRRNPSGTFRNVHWYHLGNSKKVPGAPSQGFLIFLGFNKNATKIEIWLSYPHFWADFQVSYHFGKLLTARSQGLTASKNQSLDQ